MTEYLLKMTVSEHDQILYIFSGFGVEYESVVVSITSRVEPYSLTDVRALLIAHESRIESYSVNSEGSQPTANVAFQNSQKRDSGNQRYNPGGGQQYNNNQFRRKI